MFGFGSKTPKSRWHYDIDSGTVNPCDAKTQAACPYQKNGTGIHVVVDQHPDKNVEFQQVVESLEADGQPVDIYGGYKKYVYDPVVYDYQPEGFKENTEDEPWEQMLLERDELTADEVANLVTHREMMRRAEEGKIGKLEHWLLKKYNTLGYAYEYDRRKRNGTL